MNSSNKLLEKLKYHVTGAIERGETEPITARVHEYTRVVFRVFKDGGDLIALFPHEINYPDGCCESYQRIGQHGAADYNHCMKITRPATFEEYLPLKLELESIGYKLKVQRRKSA